MSASSGIPTGSGWRPTYHSQQTITLDVRCFGVDGFEIYWFNPIYGITNKMSDDITESLILNMTTPENEQDWVLVLKAKSPCSETSGGTAPVTTGSAPRATGAHGL